VIYFEVWFQNRGSHNNKGQTLSRGAGTVATFSFFFCTYDNGYSLKQLLFKTIKVFQLTLNKYNGLNITGYLRVVL